MADWLPTDPSDYSDMDMVSDEYDDSAVSRSEQERAINDINTHSHSEEIEQRNKSDTPVSSPETDPQSQKHRSNDATRNQNR